MTRAKRKHAPDDSETDQKSKKASALLIEISQQQLLIAQGLTEAISQSKNAQKEKNQVGLNIDSGDTGKNEKGFQLLQGSKLYVKKDQNQHAIRVLKKWEMLVGLRGASEQYITAAELYDEVGAHEASTRVMANWEKMMGVGEEVEE
jgi:hypothetical protein